MKVERNSLKNCEKILLKIVRNFRKRYVLAEGGEGTGQSRGKTLGHMPKNGFTWGGPIGRRIVKNAIKIK